jgi:excisionase family DNA binding protein
MHFTIERDEIRGLVKEVVRETLATIDWPAHRLTLSEQEAAEACGVGRHVLRDLRLRGKIRARRLGRKVVYSRTDLLEALENSG